MTSPGRSSKRTSYGLIAPAIIWCCNNLRLSEYLRSHLGGGISAEDKIKDEETKGKELVQKTAARTDAIVLVRFFMALAAFLFAHHVAHMSVGAMRMVLTVVAIIFLAVLIWDVFWNVLHVAVVFAPPDMIDNERIIYDGSRSVLLGLINFLELIVAYAGVYAIRPRMIGAESMLDALYFSVITQTTVGYGDLEPIRCMRIATILQPLMGLLVITLLISQIITALPKSVDIKQYRPSGDSGGSTPTEDSETKTEC